MDIKTLEKRIDLKADAEVQDAIYKFRDAVRTALDKLFGTRMNYTSYMEKPHCRAALEILAGTRKATSKDGGGWPERLWDVRREAIRKDVMSTMDTLQKVLLAKEPTEPPTDTMQGSEPEAVPAKVSTESIGHLYLAESNKEETLLAIIHNADFRRGIIEGLPSGGYKTFGPNSSWLILRVTGDISEISWPARVRVELFEPDSKMTASQAGVVTGVVDGWLCVNLDEGMADAVVADDGADAEF